MRKTKAEVESTMLEEILTRFGRANSAELCGRALLEMLGYSASTTTSLYTLHVQPAVPEDTSAGTLAILMEIVAIWNKMEGKKVELTVTKEDFVYYW